MTLRASLQAASAGSSSSIAATHLNNTVEEFEHGRSRPALRQPHIRSLTSQVAPALGVLADLEALQFLRGNGFKTFIVSGGGVEFMRPSAERVYGIPPEQVIGSRAKMRYELRPRKTCAVPAAGDRSCG